MKSLFLVACSLVGVTLAALPCTAQTTITPSQTRLIGCFGEAFTIVEHVWRLAPTHLDLLAGEAARTATTAGGDRSAGSPAPGDADAHHQFLAGLVAAAVQVDQAGAMAVVRNLDGCITEATLRTVPDATTAVLATAMRTELDSALEDVAMLITQAAEKRDALRDAVRSVPTDRSLESPLDTYLAFGTRIKDDLVRLRARADALVAASTPTR